MGKGSMFRFSAAFDPALEKSPPDHGALVDLHGKRVLLIDDNATSGFILRETLHSWGLKSDTFRVPAEALARLPKRWLANSHMSWPS